MNTIPLYNQMNIKQETYLLPSSFSQQRVWFFEKMNPNSPTYNLPYLFKIEGNLCIDIFKAALKHLINRHEVLRTTFLEQEGVVYQKIHPEIDSILLDPIPYNQLKHSDDFEKFINHFAKQPFDLSSGPLIQFQLIKKTDTFFYLIINIHHIIFDAWSIDIFKNDLFTIYQSLKNEMPILLEPLELQYADFAQWEYEVINSSIGENQIDFWKSHLQDTPSLEIPTDFHREKISSFKGKTIQFPIPFELVKMVRLYTKQHNVTMNNYFMAIFNLLLYRYTNEEIFSIGTPISNRQDSSLQNLIGFFVNTIPIKTELSPTLKFDAFLKQMKDSFLTSFSNGSLPFEKIVQAVNPKRSSNIHPIFQILFTYHEQHKPENTIELNIETKKLATNTSKFDFVFYITTSSEDGSIEIEYNSEIYTSETLRNFVNQYLHLVEFTLLQPTTAIADIPLQGTESIGHINTEQSTIRYMHQYIENQTQLTPNHTALIYEKTRVSFETLDNMANKIANTLINKNIIEKPVAILLERSPEQIAAILGILKAGCHYIPIDPNLPSKRVDYILKDSQANFLITNDQNKNRFSNCPTIDVKKIMLDTISFEKPVFEILSTNKDLIAYIIYTSGSTGKPKGVKISHHSLINHIESFSDIFNVTKTDRLLQNITFSFDASITEIFSALFYGATLVLARSDKQFDIDYLSDLIVTNKITKAQLFHSLIENLIQNKKFINEHSLEIVVTGGEALRQSLVDKFYNQISNNCLLYNVYGPTEGTVATSYYLSKMSDSFITVPIGKPFKNYVLKVLDKNKKALPSGAIGELYIGGASVANEYVNQPKLTKEKFIEIQGMRFYSTGDLVRLDSKGVLHFISRKDSQVKIRGFRIELNEIKNTLLEISSIEDAFVCVNNLHGENRIYCFLVQRENEIHLSAREIKKRLQKTLPSYMIPYSITMLSEIPRSLNGKVLVKQLPFEKNELLDAKTEPFRTNLEQQLNTIWKKTLNLAFINRHDDFFDIGGHSIKALELISNIRKELQIDIPLSVLLEHKTIDSLSQWMSRQKHRPLANNVIIQLKKGVHSLPSIFLIHPGGGGVLCYSELAKNLNTKQSIYGIQSVGYDSTESPLTTITLMAKRYVTEIKKIQQSGPYVLLGWSMGGTVSIEIARLLEKDGEKIAFIGLLDAHPFSSAIGTVHKRTQLEVLAHSLNINLKEFNSLKEEEKVNTILTFAKKSKTIPENAELVDVKRILSVMATNNIACFNYTFNIPIQSDLTLFKCLHQDSLQPHPIIQEQEWATRTSGNLQVIEIDANHNNLLKLPQVHTICEVLNSLLI